MVRSKNSSQLTAHMPDAYLQALQNKALKLGISASQLARDVLIDYCNKEYLEAKNNVDVMRVIESDELYQIYESRQSARGYEDE